MPILALGVSHREAPVEVRERLAIGELELPGALSMLREYVSEAAILSTCNRTEIYALVGHRDTGLRGVRHFLLQWHRLAAEELPPALWERWQDGAVRHLFRVACGLESMILGEPQILGQVKGAYRVALEGGHVGRVLSRLLRQAVELGKRVRTETGISRSAVSVSYAAVELARRNLGRLDGARVLVVGAGEMGKLAALAILDQGGEEVLVTSRSPASAQQVAAGVRGSTVPFGALAQELARADVVVSCTSASEHVIGLEAVRQAMDSRSQRPMFIVDIAVPRDVDPRVRELAGVHLYNIDDLEAVSSANLQLRRAEAAKIEAPIEEGVASFMRWWDTLEVAPTITALVGRAEAIRQAELAKALPRLSELSERDRKTVDALTSAIVNKLLHRPIVRLKERGNSIDGRDLAPAVRELFELEQGGGTMGGEEWEGGLSA